MCSHPCVAATLGKNISPQARIKLTPNKMRLFYVQQCMKQLASVLKANISIDKENPGGRHAKEAMMPAGAIVFAECVYRALQMQTEMRFTAV